MPYLTSFDGTKIYYEDVGTGETILFSHGIASSHLKIKNLINEFKSEYRCVYYDQRGHEATDTPKIHLNVQSLAKDLNEIIEYLNLKEITIIGHSLGAATIYNYINQFGISKIKRIVAIDMSPYLRNEGWKGGLAQGKWTDEDLMSDLDRIFNDVGYANFYIIKEAMNPEFKKFPKEMEKTLVDSMRNIDPLIMASLWFSLFRTDQRPFIKKINVPFLYIMPEFPLYSMETVNFYKNNVQGKFVLENNIKNTTHMILVEKPVEVAQSIKKFIKG